jgi:hypothetical protein
MGHLFCASFWKPQVCESTACSVISDDKEIKGASSIAGGKSRVLSSNEYAEFLKRLAEA